MEAYVVLSTTRVFLFFFSFFSFFCSFFYQFLFFSILYFLPLILLLTLNEKSYVSIVFFYFKKKHSIKRVLLLPLQLQKISKFIYIPSSKSMNSYNFFNTVFIQTLHYIEIYPIQHYTYCWYSFFPSTATIYSKNGHNFAIEIIREMYLNKSLYQLIKIQLVHFKLFYFFLPFQP